MVLILFNLPFNIAHIQCPSHLCMLNHLLYQLDMPQLFFALHDTNDTSLDFKLSIHKHPIMRVLVLLRRFLELDLIDLDTIQLVCEAKVDGEIVGSGNIAAFG